MVLFKLKCATDIPHLLLIMKNFCLTFSAVLCILQDIMSAENHTLVPKSERLSLAKHLVESRRLDHKRFHELEVKGIDYLNGWNRNAISYLDGFYGLENFF